MGKKIAKVVKKAGKKVPAPVKKIVKSTLKSKAAPAVAEEEEEEEETAPARTVPNHSKPGKFIEAFSAEVGTRYLNWSLHTVISPTGKKRTAGGEPYQEVLMEAWDDQGHKLDEFWVKAYYPLRIDKEGVARVMEEHERKRVVLANRDAGRRVKEATEEVVEIVDGEEVITVKKVAKATRAPRADADPKTGCRPGTSSHNVGLVMLGEKPGPNHRANSVAKMVATLGMAKPLAQSWYSTHVRGRASIYAGLRRDK